MKRAILFFAAVCSAALLISLDADARRLGGGRSFGTPRDTVTPRQATPPAGAAAQPAAPVAAAAPRPATPTPPAVQQPAWKRWIGPIAGIAAGLGIAALMSHLGLSEAFGSFLLIALLVIAAIFVIRLLFFRRPAQSEGIQYRGAGLAGAGAAGGPTPPQPIFGGAGGSPAQSISEPAKPYPPDFDPEPFVRQAKVNFVKLQAAYDQADSTTLRDVMTPEMFAEISKDIETRGLHHPTEVVTLNAEILEVTTENNAHWASVRFTGLLREDNAPTPAAFDEVWNLTKPLSGETGWLLSGIQQLQ